MAVDLGATIRLTFDATDAAGDLVDVATIGLAITQPDGTQVTPAPVVTNPPATTGKYSYDYVPAVQHGRYWYRWTGTGPAVAYTDVFYVRNPQPGALFGLADGKDHLNIAQANTSHDGELRDAIEGVTDVVESIVGAMVRRTVAEVHSGRGGPGIVLRRRPLSITTVTENGTALDPDGYSLSDGGVLYRVSGYTDLRWPCGRNNIQVVYEAGAPGQVIPPAVLDAGKELLRINFRPQIAGNYSVFNAGAGDDAGTGTGQMRLGFFVPNVVMQRLEPFALGPVVA